MHYDWDTVPATHYLTIPVGTTQQILGPNTYRWAIFWAPASLLFGDEYQISQLPNFLDGQGLCIQNFASVFPMYRRQSGSSICLPWYGLTTSSTLPFPVGIQELIIAPGCRKKFDEWVRSTMGY